LNQFNMKLTGKEIIEKLKDTHLTVEQFAFEENSYLPQDQIKIEQFSKGKQWNDPELLTMRNNAANRASQYFHELVGKWEEIEQIGGEGEGDTWFSIKYFNDHDVYLKVSGYYQSHYGTDFDDWDNAVKEVKPKEKTITVYE
jgi:hypothetical protein